MRASLIIPTYRRPESLERTLESAFALTPPEQDYEVLVVDNAADPAVERLVSELSGFGGRRARYIPEPELGLHHARHAGARAAAGELLVFTDDDATFDPDLLVAYERAFADHPEMGAAGGPVRPVWEAPVPDWLRRWHESSPSVFYMLSLMEPHQGFRLDEEGGYFFGVNMALRRDLLFELGGFNPESFGDYWVGDGESGVVAKMWARKWPIGYVPNAVVHHHIPAERLALEYLCHRMANQGRCVEYGRFHGGIPGPVGLTARMARIGWSMFRLLLSTAKRLVLGDPLAWPRLRTNSAYNRARLLYVIQLFRDPMLRELVTRERWLDEGDGETIPDAPVVTGVARDA